MDAALLSMMQTGGRNKAWVDMMVNMEARKLVSTANAVAASHLHDGITRVQFMDDIRNLIRNEFDVAQKATSDDECIQCIQRLRDENTGLQEQSRLLRMQTARIYAKVEFVKQNNKIVGYMISAINVVMSGLTVVGGVALFGTMNPLGMLAGATLVVDGINGITREINHNFLGQPDS